MILAQQAERGMLAERRDLPRRRPMARGFKRESGQMTRRETGTEMETETEDAQGSTRLA